MICNHQRRRLEIEKEELQSALEEAEAALEQEENKVSSVHLATSVWNARIWLGNGIMCGQKNEQIIPKAIACAGDACPAGLGSGKQTSTPSSGSKITFWDFAVLHNRDLRQLCVDNTQRLLIMHHYPQHFCCHHQNHME